jgi:hypothetical protein
LRTLLVTLVALGLLVREVREHIGDITRVVVAERD